MIWLNIHSTSLRALVHFLSRSRPCVYGIKNCTLNTFFSGKNPTGNIGCHLPVFKCNHRNRYSYQSLQPKNKKENWEETRFKQNNSKIKKSLNAIPNLIESSNSNQLIKGKQSMQPNSIIPFKNKVTKNKKNETEHWCEKRNDKDVYLKNDVQKEKMNKSDINKTYIFSSLKIKSEGNVGDNRSIPKLQGSSSRSNKTEPSNKKVAESWQIKNEGAKPTEKRTKLTNSPKKLRRLIKIDSVQNKPEINITETSITKTDQLNQQKAIQKVTNVDNQLIVGGSLPRSKTVLPAVISQKSKLVKKTKKLNAIINIVDNLQTEGKFSRKKYLPTNIPSTRSGMPHKNEIMLLREKNLLEGGTKKTPWNIKQNKLRHLFDNDSQIVMEKKNAKKQNINRNFYKYKTNFEFPRVNGEDQMNVPESEMIPRGRTSMHPNVRQTDNFVENIAPVNINSYSTPAKSRKRGIRVNIKRFEFMGAPTTTDEMDSNEVAIPNFPPINRNNVETNENGTQYVKGQINTQINSRQPESPSLPGNRMLNVRSTPYKKNIRITTPVKRTFLPLKTEFTDSKHSMKIKDWFRSRRENFKI